MFYSLLDLRSSECNVNGSVGSMCCVFYSVCELFVRNVLGVVAILLLNVMEVFSVGGGALLDIPCMVFQRMCVLCIKVIFPYVLFMFLYVGSYLLI